MAPLRSLPSPAAKPRKSILKSSGSSAFSAHLARPEPLFANSKKDKRMIKHAQLMSKVSKSTTKPKRRRPNKKLVTTLDSLVHALPDDEGAAASGAGPRAEDQVNIIHRKSMKSKPGALKRREKIDRIERERFQKNMAQLAGHTVTEADKAGTISIPTATTTTTTDKWAALRGFISQTLEQRTDIKASGG